MEHKDADSKDDAGGQGGAAGGGDQGQALQSSGKGPGQSATQKHKHKYDKLEEQKQQEKRRTLFGVRKSGAAATPQADGTESSKSGPSLDFLTDSSAPDQTKQQAESKKKKEKLGEGAEDDQKPFYSCIIISETSRMRASFNMFMMLVIMYNCVVVILQLCYSYDNKNSNFWWTFDWIVEGFYLLDMIFNFLQEYRDPDSQLVVSSIKQIARNYVITGSFILDFVAIIPFQIFFDAETGGAGLVSLKIIRLTRLTRIIKLLDTAKVNHILKSMLDGDNSQDKIMMQFIFINIWKAIRLFIFAIILTFLAGSIWFLITHADKDNPVSFYNAYELGKDRELYEVVVLTWYYAMTTVTTVGYGDLSPQTETEIGVAIVLMLAGVVFFSFIMSSMNDILTNQGQKIQLEDKSSSLQNWLTLLSRFKQQKPLPKSLYEQIHNHFEFYWTYDRLAAINQHSNTLAELPKSMKRKLMTNYIFQDIFNTFKFFFKSSQDANREQKFLYDISHGFLPRNFNPNQDPEDTIIYDEEDEVPEMYFCLEGIVSVGYFFDSRNSTKNEFRPVRKFAQMFIICDHYVVNNTRCEFVFMVNQPVKCFALTKKFLLKDIFLKYPDIASEIQSAAHLRYLKYLRKPIKEKLMQDVKRKNKRSSHKIIMFMDKKSKDAEKEERRETKKADWHSGNQSSNFNSQLPHQTTKSKLGSERHEIGSKTPFVGALVGESELMMASSRGMSYSAAGLANSKVKTKGFVEENELEKKIAEEAKLEKHMSNELQGKMKSIREEVIKFNGEIDEFSKICDVELGRLHQNVEKVALNIEEALQQQSEAK